MRPESEAGGWEAGVGLLPAVGKQRIARSWCGLEAESVDGIPLIGHVPGYDGLTLAVGFTGHGFALAPAVGRAVADLLTGSDVPELAGLLPSRMAAMDADAVDQFIAAAGRERAVAG